MTEKYFRNKEQAEILVVDDNPINTTILSAILSSQGYKVRQAANGHLALKSIQMELPDLILMDIIMPDIDGFEVCNELKKNKLSRSVPIIFISALDDDESKIKAFSMGGVDYISKPFNNNEVIARVKTHLELQQLNKNLENRVKERTKELDIYRKIVSASKDNLSFIDRDYRYRAVNKSLEEYYNLPQEEIIGRSPAVLLGKEKFENEIKPKLDSCFSGKQVKDKYTRIHDNGVTRYFDVNMIPYYETDAKISGCVINTRDITEQKKNENAINLAYSELDQIFHSAGDGMYLVDNDCNIIRANNAFIKMMNIDIGEVQGKKCYDIFSYKVCNTPNCHLTRILDGEDRIEFTYYKKAGENSNKYFEMTAAPLKDTYGATKGMVVNVKDITQRVKAEEREKAREQQMVQTEKLAAIGVLSAGIAHELNNPNGVIMLNISMINSYWGSVEPILEKYYEAYGDFKLGGANYTKLKDRIPYLLQQTIESSKRIKKIISELKDFARQEVMDMSEIDLNDVIRTSISLVSNKIKKSTTCFKVEYEKNPVIILGSFQRLEQVFINALINSCESLSDSTNGISVKVSSDSITKNAIVEIRDEGVGIKKSNMKNIFNPFFTTKRDSGGTGLGLSVSHGIISEHGGEIRFDSPGKGTVCMVTIPLSNNNPYKQLNRIKRTRTIPFS